MSSVVVFSLFTIGSVEGQADTPIFGDVCTMQSNGCYGIVEDNRAGDTGNGARTNDSKRFLAANFNT